MGLPRDSYIYAYIKKKVRDKTINVLKILAIWAIFFKHVEMEHRWALLFLYNRTYGFT